MSKFSNVEVFVESTFLQETRTVVGYQGHTYRCRHSGAPIHYNLLTYAYSTVGDL